MRPYKPFTSFFGRKGTLNVSLIIISRKIEWVTRSYIIINQGVILNDTEFLIGIEWITLSISIKLLVWWFLSLLFLFFLSSFFFSLLFLIYELVCSIMRILSQSFSKFSHRIYSYRLYDSAIIIHWSNISRTTVLNSSQIIWIKFTISKI